MFLVCSLPRFQRHRKCFFFRARAEKGIASHVDASSVVQLLITYKGNRTLKVFLFQAQHYVTKETMSTHCPSCVPNRNSTMSVYRLVLQHECRVRKNNPQN